MMMKALLLLIMVAFSLSVQADELKLEPIEEMPNINSTTNWMKITTRKLSVGKQYQQKLDEEHRKSLQEATDLCLYAKSDKSMSLCEQSLTLQKSGKSAVEPVRLMIKAAIIESDEVVRVKMIEHASMLARKRMNQDAFEKLIDEVSI